MPHEVAAVRLYTAQSGTKRLPYAHYKFIGPDIAVCSLKHILYISGAIDISLLQAVAPPSIVHARMQIDLQSHPKFK